MENILEVNDNNIYQILENDIDTYTELYIQSLPDPENIYNSYTFQGLLSYLCRNVFRVSFNRDYKRTSVIDYNNVNHLYTTWLLYKYICAKYKKAFTFLGYTVFIGVSTADISNWESGNNNNIIEFINTVKRESETGLQDKTINDNGIGSMFILKAKYGYSETPQTVIIDTAAAHNKPDSIADKYGSMPDLPEKPV